MSDYLLGGAHSSAPRKIIEDPEVDLHVPSLCDVEVAAVVRRGLLGGSLTEARATDVIEDYLDLPITRHGHGWLIPDALRLRSNFSVYDAIYVVLAARLGAEFLTGDKALVRAVETFLQVPTIRTR